VGQTGLQVVVHNVKVLELGERLFRRQRALDQELALPRVHLQPITGVDAQLVAHTLQYQKFTFQKIISTSSVNNRKILTYHFAYN